uniref:Putative linoleate 9S-lipoxygenase 5 n=1 Tax=Anthurium amnicola TaxID=1678845 RepID=A0A1D1YN37_9ARAE
MEASQLKWAKPAAAIRRPRGSVEQHASTVALETTPAKAHCHATNPTPTSLSSKVLLFPPSVAPRSPVPLHPLASRRVDGRRRTRVMAQTTLQRVADAPAPTRVDKEEDQPQGDGGSPAVMIKGTVVLIKSNVVGFNNFWKSFLDWVDELRGNGVVFQLVSATVGDPDKGNRGKVGKPANLQGWTTTPTSLSAVEYRFNVTFEWEEALGIPGAVIVKNHHNGEFYLESLILEGVPGPNRRLHFDCNSWVYPVRAYNYDRVFFTNDAYLPGDMPEPLKAYRWEELFFLRGDYITRQLQIPDRVYGYAYYNNLGKPDKGPDYVRPVLGGSKEYPYPRRARTGLPPTMSDLNAESRLPLTKSLNVYVPRDERFSDVKLSDFLAWAFKSGTQALVPAAQAYICGWNFQTFGDQMQLYEGSIKLPEFPENIRKLIPFELFRELLRSDGEQLFKLPMPQVIQGEFSLFLEII